MRQKVVAVCSKCDEQIDLTKNPLYDDTCIHCGGKVSDKYGKVFILEITDNRPKGIESTESTE